MGGRGLGGGGGLVGADIAALSDAGAHRAGAVSVGEHARRVEVGTLLLGRHCFCGHLHRLHQVMCS